MSGITVISSTQRIVVDPFSSAVAVVNAGPVGPGGPIGEVSLSLLETELSTKQDTYSGTGSPNGVVTATIGSEYIDTAAVAGNVLKWIKTTNTGSTGWLALFTIPT